MMPQATKGVFRTVAKMSDLEDERSLIIDVEGTAVGVIKHKGKLYAFRNSCPHQGGPVAEGSIVANVECEVTKGGARREYDSAKNVNIACPWHGIEYDIETGVCRGDARMKLKSYEVVVQDGLVKVKF
jgi:nitrite reductase (NADH) small subunit